MIPYFILLLAPLIYNLYARHGKVAFYNIANTREQKIVIGLFFSIFLFLLSLRGLSCGSDTRTYLFYFQHDTARSFNEILHSGDIEVAFTLLEKVISVITKEFQIYITIIAIVCVLPLWRLYLEESEIPYLSIVLFLIIAPFSLYFSGLRQALSVSIGSIAYFFCKRKKIIPYIFTCFIALLFHQSAIMLFLMYPIYRAKITRNWLYVVIPIMALTFAMNSRIYTAIAPLMGERYFTRYGAVSSTGAYSTLLMLFVFAVFSILVLDSDNMDEDTIGLRNLLFLSVCLQCFAPVNNIAMRMNYYYLIFVPLEMPKVITRSKKQYKQVAQLTALALCVVFCVYFVYNMYNGSDIMQLYPYVGFWQNQ